MRHTELSSSNSAWLEARTREKTSEDVAVHTDEDHVVPVA